MRFALVLLFLTTLILPLHTRAEDNIPYHDEIKKQAAHLKEILTEEEAQQFIQIRDSYGMIRGVKLIRSRIEKVAALCGDKNPEMKEKMDARFAGWDAAVSPPLEKQESAYDAIIDSDWLTHRNEIKSYLALIDKSAMESQKSLDENPLTTAKSCEGLRQSMDHTEQKIAGLLASIEWPKGAPAKSKPRASKKEQPE